MGRYYKDSPIGRVHRAIERDDWSWVAGWVCGRWGVDVTEEWCRTTFCRHHRGKFDYGYWSDGCQAMFWKQRLEEAGHFHTGHQSHEVRLEVELHMGFLSVVETKEHLANLDLTLGLEKFEQYAAASSKIARTQTMPTPIDRVAARVVIGR